MSDRLSADKNQLATGTLPKAPRSLPEPLKEATRNWKQWRRRFQWDLRAAEYDRFVEQEDAEELRTAIKTMNLRHATVAAALLNKVIERLQTLTGQDLRPADVARTFEIAANVERRARGQATELVKHLSGAADVTALDASKLTDEELDLLERLHARAAPGRPDGA